MPDCLLRSCPRALRSRSSSRSRRLPGSAITSVGVHRSTPRRARADGAPSSRADPRGCRVRRRPPRRDLCRPGNQRLGHRSQREPVTRRRRARPEHRTARPPRRRQSGPASRRSRRELHHAVQPNSAALQAAQIAATCRASVPQHPPSTVTAGKPIPQTGVPGGEVGRIALVEFGGLVEFGVALRRRVRTQSDEPLQPCSVNFEGVREMRRVRTVDHEVGGAGICFGVHLLDRLTQRLSRRQPAVGLDRERDRRRECPPRRRPARYRSPPLRWSS